MNTQNQKQDFKLPEVSYDPVATIGMEGRVFRGLVDSKKKRSPFVRITAIVLFSLWFLLPGITIVCVSIYQIVGFVSSGFQSSNSSDFYAYTLGFPLLALVGIFFIIIGGKVVWSNMRR